ncbi:PAC2 family protein [Galactobacter caseinivorans]|uniref:PAC2 family protein n=2 Tax=Galactobacter caseinivorans TaxID=2676123 RepID=A0A496PMC7_9MICC|nr:PAC2 family protein [Galactobacter caseinivorans]
MRAEELMDVYAGARRRVAGKGLPVVTLLDGVFDAGGAVAAMRSSLIDGLASTPLAEFDADLLVDHRATRPRITFHDGSFSSYTAPRLAVDVLTDDLGNQALLFSGAEPVLGWERIAAAFGELLDDVGAGSISVVHSVPLPVPHTRPISIRRHGDDSGESIGPFEIPASFSHLVETRLTEAGRDVSGMTIQVPHYIADSEYPPAAVAGLEAIAADAGLAVPTEELRQAGREVDAHIAAQIEDNPDAERLVAGLELRYDVDAPQLAQRSTLVAEGEQVPDGDELGAAAERYLRSVDEAEGQQPKDQEK